MDIEEMKDFYDIDTFDDKLFEKAAKKNKKIQKAEFHVEGNSPLCALTMTRHSHLHY